VISNTKVPREEKFMIGRNEPPEWSCKLGGVQRCAQTGRTDQIGASQSADLLNQEI